MLEMLNHAKNITTQRKLNVHIVFNKAHEYIYIELQYI